MDMQILIRELSNKILILKNAVWLKSFRFIQVSNSEFLVITITIPDLCFNVETSDFNFGSNFQNITYTLFLTEIDI